MAWHFSEWTPFLAVTLPALALVAAQIRLAGGSRLSSVTVALVLMALVAVMIQQAHGLVEMHFGVFVVLALLLYYRHWLPVVVAAAAIAVHHLAFYWMQARGLPIQVFAPGSGFGFVLLHAAYVVVEAGFVCVMAVELGKQVDALGHGPRRLAELARGVAEGEPVPEEMAGMRFPRGSLAEALVQMSDQIRMRQAAERDMHQENARIRIALDASSKGLMIADAGHVIRYANGAVVELLRGHLGELRQAFGEFDPDALIGTSIHRFHRDPDRIRALLNGLRGLHRSAIRIGQAHLALGITPVTGRDGQPESFIVEWEDRTQELRVEEEVAGIIAGAAQGHLDRRLHVVEQPGFLQRLTGGINHLLDATAGSLAEVRRLLSALAEGDLSRRIERPFEGAFGQMKDDANATADRLADIVGRIARSSTTINAAAGEIASGNGDLSHRTEQQAAHLEETAASLEELTSTVRQNAEHARQASRLVGGAATVATQGGEVVEDVVTTMSAIEASSRKIAEIISVIDGIAFQTNILALNAAVEAARAGEQGRGFAVVASEVRALAQRSANAAKEIKDLIDDSVGKVAAGSNLVRRAGDTMREIVASVHEVTGIVTEISAASQEQYSGIEQVNRTVVQMDGATQQNAAMVEEASAAARAMEEQARQLAEVVAVFRLDGHGAGPGGRPTF